ncbi:CheR family methyltransferase [Maritalea mediterranea]|uniref:protein-glutamate O-methyltransferase n=1 Tax=Maritalea mediterranea TaxID=2909667 RepID=A0ABS9EA12_9HYPH|nr:protein-glutamate O-methyltransferase CheR [Maritalea mediterranea]MCF4099724.1 protein-glutamate O-methyltransferase CheR [Maritalea mediterranea]
MLDHSVSQISTFMQQRAGIKLTSNKIYMIEARLEAVVQRFGFAHIDALAASLPRAMGEVQQAVVDALATNESYFFRDQKPFDAFEQALLPAAIEQARLDQRPVRIWCAAAATGQEPYSLAMLLAEKKHQWLYVGAEIVATDLSQTALARAESGLFTQFEVQRGLSAQRLVQFFTQQGSQWQIAHDVRKMVQFNHHNLLHNPARLGQFDMILCRNVLIYFDVETKQQILTHLARQLPPDGALVLGASETLVGVTDQFRPDPDLPMVFRRV